MAIVLSNFPKRITSHFDHFEAGPTGDRVVELSLHGGPDEGFRKEMPDFLISYSFCQTHKCKHTQKFVLGKKGRLFKFQKMKMGILITWSNTPD